MTSQQTSIAQRSKEKIYFDHRDMDYYLSWIMGREIYDGSDTGECLEAARQIMDGDAQSWQQVWSQLAHQLETQAHALHTRGASAEARSTYLRACSYYRAPLFVMPPNVAAFRENWQKMRSCFQVATSLFDSPIERIEVPYNGHMLAGYFWKADRSEQARPTLIVIGGIETFAEDCYFIIGQTGAQRGYNVLTVDLPGQGMNPEQGLFFGARMEFPIKAVIDYALQRPEIDPRRLFLFGFSWGGHIVFKGAQYDTRIKALIANPAMPNVFRAVRGQQQGHNRNDPIAKLVFAQIAWRMGLKISLHPRAIGRRIAKAYDYFVYGTAKPELIRCPTLCLAGEGEAPITIRIAHECFAQLPNPRKKLVVFTKEQNGASHCQINNLALPNKVIFDWLDAL